MSRFEDLFAALYAAGASHHHNLLAADGGTIGPDQRILGDKIAAGQLVWAHHAHGVLHAIQNLECARIELMLIRPNDADDRSRLASAQMYLVAKLFDTPDNAFDLFRFCTLLHHDDHLCFPLTFN